MSNLKFGLVTDRILIRKLKASYGGLWFQEDALTTMVIKRYDGQLSKLDLLEGPELTDIQFFVNRMSLPLVTEVSDESL